MSTLTPNLGLHQWVSSDYVNHEDFNADNLIIDGALSHVNRYLISESTVPSAGTKLEIDLTGINWAQYEHVFVEVTADITDTYTEMAYNLFNVAAGSNDSWCCLPGITSNVGSAGYFTVKGGPMLCIYRFNPYKNASAPVSFEMTSQKAAPLWGGDSVITYSALTKLIIMPNGSMHGQDGAVAAGAKIKIWGTK